MAFLNQITIQILFFHSTDHAGIFVVDFFYCLGCLNGSNANEMNLAVRYIVILYTLVSGLATIYAQITAHYIPIMLLSHIYIKLLEKKKKQKRSFVNIT
jgi:hypothetical protein